MMKNEPSAGANFQEYSRKCEKSQCTEPKMTWHEDAKWLLISFHIFKVYPKDTGKLVLYNRY